MNCRSTRGVLYSIAITTADGNEYFESGLESELAVVDLAERLIAESGGGHADITLGISQTFEVNSLTALIACLRARSQ